MKALILHGGDNRIEQSPSCVTLRDDLIESTALIETVGNPVLLQIAIDAVKDLKAMVRAVEGNRVEVKAPVLTLSSQIDETAKAFVRPLLLELSRLEGQIGTYSREQQRIRDEAARKLREAQEAEERRIRAEQEAENRRIREEQARANREAEAKRQADLAKARSESEARRIQEQAEREKAENERRAAEALAQSQAAAAASVGETRELFVAPPPPKVPVKMIPKCEVVDVLKVLAACPNLIRWELNTSEFNRMIASGVRVIPGCRVWEEAEVRIR